MGTRDADDVRAPEGWVDPYQRVQDFLDSCSPVERHVALVRLAMKDNNGDQHFDHGEPGYSWLCHRCALEGRGGLNGWVGALQMLGTIARNDGPMRCDNCGKTMAEHDAMAHCWPAHNDGQES